MGAEKIQIIPRQNFLILVKNFIYRLKTYFQTLFGYKSVRL